MKIKNKSNLFAWPSTRVLFLLLLLLGASFFVVQADDASITQISGSAADDEADKQAKLDELEKRAQIYQQIIDIKQKQGATLNNQISIMDTNLVQVKSQIQTSESQISDLNDKITLIQKQIETKNDSIKYQKVLLSNLIELYYEFVNQNPTVFFLNQSNISNTLSSKDQLAQLGDKVREISDSLKKMRDDFQSQSISLDQKKTEIVGLHDNLQNQNNNLQGLMAQKQILLDQTRGEEARYQQLLARVEEQKQELLDVDQLAEGLSADNYVKPPASLFASTSWFYSQRDPKWANQLIGNSNSTLKAYGCAVASVAMVFTKHGAKQTPETLARKPIFSWDLIAWPQSWPEAKLAMSSDGNGHGNINWSTIDSQLSKGNPVIVYVGKTNSKGGHYVVVHHKELSTGKYVVHDPYFGSNIYLDTTRALVGAMGQNSGTKMDQMIIYK